MKYLVSLLTLFIFHAQSIAQHNYWQQEVDYKMTIDFDVEKHQFYGHQVLNYTNNSPDTLDKVFYHLYFNAFQPGSMMDVRSQYIMDPDPRVGDRISKLTPDEIGYHKISMVMQNGERVNYEVEETILVVYLNEPILPGASTLLELDFNSQVPLQIRRSGRDNEEGIDYSMTQWYPKLCEYDVEGWHSNPYIGREFHGVWGKFEVIIDIDSSYVLGGTGYLQNPQEVGHGYEDKTKPLNRPNSNKLKWHFKAPKVHDFAWGADPDFTHEVKKVGDNFTFHFLYQKSEKTKAWEEFPAYMERAFGFMNETFGQYPFKQYSFIQGGDGGMEYPMCTLITGERSLNSLVGVGVHEAAHSWFQGVLATNEALYSWMDEGFTTYATSITMDYLFDVKQINPLARSYKGYSTIVNNGYQEPLTTHADHYKTNYAYGTNAYSKGAILLHQLGYVIGKENLAKGMLEYYNTWKFKHPTPRDFKRVMEKVSGLELDWYFEHFVGTTNSIDYGIPMVKEEDGSTIVTLERVGDMPMPIDVVVKLKDGSTKNFYIPLELMRGEKGNDWYVELTTLPDWQWVNPYYAFRVDNTLDEIEGIVIDPSMRMADVNMSNNTYPARQEKSGKKDRSDKKTKAELKKEYKKQKKAKKEELKAYKKEMKQKIKNAPEK